MKYIMIIMSLVVSGFTLPVQPTGWPLGPMEELPPRWLHLGPGLEQPPAPSSTPALPWSNGHVIPGGPENPESLDPEAPEPLVD
jgi:hypothetical protein